MARTEQVLTLEPSHELKFCGPFDDVITSTLKLINPTDKKVCFKVKTTAPRRYCVRPNSGAVEPKGAVPVAVMLQPFDYDPLEKNKHKFMVQTIFAPEGDVNLDALFKEADPSELMDSKLRCVFEMPSEPSAPEHNADGIAPPPQPTETLLKSSPKIQSVNDGELRKAHEEIKRLREEASYIRQENLQIKEDMLRVRSSQPYAPSDRKSALPGKPALDVSTPAINPAVLYAVAFAILLLGYILGKYIF